MGQFSQKKAHRPQSLNGTLFFEHGLHLAALTAMDTGRVALSPLCTCRLHLKRAQSNVCFVQLN